MEPDIIYDELEDLGYEPTASTLIRATDGFVDIVEGTESANANFLLGMMYSSGVAPQVSGTEGFVSTISDSVKKAWEYVKRLFKSLYDSIFNRSAKAKIEEIDKIVKELDEAVKPKKDEKEITAVLNKVSYAIVKKEIQTAMITSVIEDAKKEENVAKKAALTDKVVAHFFDNGVAEIFKKRHIPRIEELIKDLEEKKDVLVKGAKDDKYDSKQKSQFESLSRSLVTVLNGTLKVVPAMRKVTSLSGAQEFIHAAQRAAQAMDNNVEDFRSHLRFLKERITKIENSVSKDDRAIVQTEIKQVTVVLVVTQNIVDSAELLIAYLLAASKDIGASIFK